MKTPSWWKRKSLFAFCLLPLSAMYFIAVFIERRFIIALSARGKYIICVGNIASGGAGKTPMCIMIAELLKSHNVKFAFVSRGYGRKAHGFFEVVPNANPGDVGDEPFLLSKHGKTFVFSHSRDVLNIDADVLIMDDGLQNFRIKKDLSILCINKTQGLWNGLLFPAGPLREFLFQVKRRVDAAVLIGKGDFTLQLDVPKFEIVPKYTTNLQVQKVVAFSGLSDNSKFLRSLQEYGFDVVKFYEFADHYDYKLSDVERIVNTNLPIITTEKDFVKMPPEFANRVSVFKIEYLKNADLEKFIIGKLAR